MNQEIPKQYDPRQAQSRWFEFWESNGYFNADPNPDKKQHTIVIPLPNVTGALHLGHALNGTIQDLITRWKRMQGYEALWVPGTDHAGIATQAVVERRMFEEEGLTRHDIGREALVNRIWRWKDAYESRILNQLKQLGASCDWRRTRFTLDDLCSKAVRRTFFKLFKDGLIYRGKRLVNWDTFLQTAVANDEVFHEEVDGQFWTFTYPVVGSDEKIAFSTTRPETMLGDTAICVHPNDERYKHLVGKNVRIPLNDREIPIIADGQLANMELGTGAVKVTPAHDPNDYECGLRNNLPMINILEPDGTLNENAGKFQGKDRLKVRNEVVEAMKEAGYFVEVESRKIELAHSDRSKTPVEPYLSDQWFVKMDDLAQTAMDVVEEKKVRFYPSRYAKTYLDWLGEKRDWCISRQLWWGHRIPVWTAPLNYGGSINPKENTIDSSLEKAKQEAPSELTRYFEDAGLSPSDFHIQIVGENLLCCAENSCTTDAITALCEFNNEILESISNIREGEPYPIVKNFTVPRFAKATEAALSVRSIIIEEFAQDEYVLDTWFSSALWPQATLGWPDTDHNPPLNNQPDESGEGKNRVLDYFYPGSVLITSRDIITLWVARMVLMGLYNLGDIPFAQVNIHPKILDGFGQGMSKSKGNGVDPMDLIDKYGTDAVRFTMASIAGETQDVRLPIGYECPHCENVIPQTIKHQKAKPVDGKKPTIKCPACKKESQFSSPSFETDLDVPVARMVSERFEFGRNFCNKLWNASRFAMMNLEGYTAGSLLDPPLSSQVGGVSDSDGLTPPQSPPEGGEILRLEDRWILSRLSRVQNELNTCLSRYQLDGATRAVRDFTWNEFCDWYLEMIKPRLRDDELRPVAQRVLVGVLDSLLRMLHPFVPFITEELWHQLKTIAPQRGLLKPTVAEESAIVAAWPELPESWQDAELESRFERLQETIVAVRNVRAINNIPPKTPLKLHIKCSEDIAADLKSIEGQFENLSNTMLGAVGVEVKRPSGSSASFSMTDANGFVPLEGIIDKGEEFVRKQKEADKLRGFIASNEKKLANEKFVSNAPPEVIEKVRETLSRQKKQLQSIKQIIDELS